MVVYIYMMVLSRAKLLGGFVRRRHKSNSYLNEAIVVSSEETFLGARIVATIHRQTNTHDGLKLCVYISSHKASWSVGAEAERCLCGGGRFVGGRQDLRVS